MNLCKFKNIFGKPNEGIHSYRLFDIAIFDVLFTVILALLISIIFKISFVYILIILFIMGFLLHYIFCVETTINKYVYNLFIKK